MTSGIIRQWTKIKSVFLIFVHGLMIPLVMTGRGPGSRPPVVALHVLRHLRLRASLG